MFGKLLKYEFKAPGKWYLSLYAIAGLLSLILGLWVRTLVYRDQHNLSFSQNGISNTEGFGLVVIILAFAVLIVALMFSTFFLIASRFYNNVYGRQGYLTMTLPVTGHQIIMSKLVAAVIWNFLATLMVFVGLVIIAAFALSGNPDAWEGFIDGIFEGLPNFAHINFLEIIIFFISMFISTLLSVLVGYFAISLGQLFRDHRILIAIAFFIGLQFVVGIIQSFTSFATIYTFTETTFSFDANPVLILINILLAIGCYFGTYYIMTKKLNLQ